MKHSIGPLAKLDCFCTQKNIYVFTFSRPQTRWADTGVLKDVGYCNNDLHCKGEQLKKIKPLLPLFIFRVCLFVFVFSSSFSLSFRLGGAGLCGN